MTTFRSRVIEAGYRHWLVVALLVVGCIWLGHILGEAKIWRVAHSRVYGFLQRLDPRQPGSLRTALVLIEDEEYWKGRLAGRAPTKRDYLAQLVRALDAANAAVIAIDFDLRSPAPDGSLVAHPDYYAETSAFVNAVRDVSTNRAVVLPRTLGRGPNGGYVAESAIYDGPDSKLVARSESVDTNLYEGYIEGAFDLRRIPSPVNLRSGRELAPFSLAIVSAYDQQLAIQRRKAGRTAFPFSSFIAPSQFITLSADTLLKSHPRELSDLAHKIVIIGARWHSLGYNRGALVDSHLTPVGYLQGAFVHANYVEALLQGRAVAPLRPAVLFVIEGFLVWIVAFLVVTQGPMGKVATALIACLAFILANYFLLQNFGLYADFLAPLLFIGADALIDGFLLDPRKVKDVHDGTG